MKCELDLDDLAGIQNKGGPGELGDRRRRVIQLIPGQAPVWLASTARLS
jgi:hypothetical protein